MVLKIGDDHPSTCKYLLNVCLYPYKASQIACDFSDMEPILTIIIPLNQ